MCRSVCVGALYNGRRERIQNSGEDYVLDTQHTLRKGVGGVAVEHGDRPHRKWWPCIVLLRYKVHRNGGLLQSCGNDRLVDSHSVHPRTAEPGKWTRMNVDNPSAKFLYDTAWNKPQVAGQRDNLNVAARDDPREVIFRARIEHQCVDTGSTGTIERSCATAIGSNKGDFTARGIAKGREMIENRLQV